MLGVGEAANPGPAGHGDLPANLEEVALVSRATQQLQERVLEEFRDWTRQRFSTQAERSLTSEPLVFCSLVRVYGDWCFQNGFPMYKFRHLLAWLQKNRFELRPFLPLCWDLLTCWERIRPPIHRTPLPKAVFEAMMSLALQRGWVRWACVTGLAFYGVARLGEPLRAARSDLLLPSDLLDSELSGCFLQIRKPKSGFRGRGVVQHCSIKQPEFVRFLDWHLSGLAGEEPLYPGSAHAYRNRWNSILQTLSIPTSARFTPGSLRGGGAVAAYHAGVPIADLLWRMRLRHQMTLESYLQEVSALSTLRQLPPNALSAVRAASSLFPVFLGLRTTG